MLCLWNPQTQTLYGAVEQNSQTYFMIRMIQLQEITFIPFYPQRRVSAHLPFYQQLVDSQLYKRNCWVEDCPSHLMCKIFFDKISFIIPD